MSWPRPEASIPDSYPGTKRGTAHSVGSEPRRSWPSWLSSKPLPRPGAGSPRLSENSEGLLVSLLGDGKASQTPKQSSDECAARIDSDHSVAFRHRGRRTLRAAQADNLQVGRRATAGPPPDRTQCPNLGKRLGRLHCVGSARGVMTNTRPADSLRVDDRCQLCGSTELVATRDSSIATCVNCNASVVAPRGPRIAAIGASLGRYLSRQSRARR